jgi:hypothetical protein
MVRPIIIISIAVLSILLQNHHVCTAFTPELNHRALAGLWKLTQPSSSSSASSLSIPYDHYPMKEFTTYPKDKEIQNKRAQQSLRAPQQQQQQQQQQESEMLLMLKEDGSFRQYAQDDQESSASRIPDKLVYHEGAVTVLEGLFGHIQGRWDFVDKQLILAADRPKNSPKPEDVLLVGEVVAISERGLLDNPVLLENSTSATAITNEASSNSSNSNINTSPFASATKLSQDSDSSLMPSSPTGSSSLPSATKTDTYLTVPNGKVSVGKFTYPKNHPNFFDQPMFCPTTKGNFRLAQVLGSLNTQNYRPENELVEKFRVSVFYGKRFLLTAHPLKEQRAKGTVRWSIKYNRFVGE